VQKTKLVWRSEGSFSSGSSSMGSLPETSNSCAARAGMEVHGHSEPSAFGRDDAENIIPEAPCTDPAGPRRFRFALVGLPISSGYISASA